MIRMLPLEVGVCASADIPARRVSIMHKFASLGVVCLALSLAVGCSTYKETGGSTAAEVRQSRDAVALNTVSAFKKSDPSLTKFFDDAYGYVVFPSIGKGAVGIGGAYDDDGVVFRGGKAVGDATLSQGTIGFQLGGQVYSEIIFFATEHAFNDFTNGNLEFSAQASAVAADKGAAANADYEAGVAVFTQAKGGLMYEASIGGQKFSYSPR